MTVLIWYHPCRNKFVTVLIWYHPCRSKFVTVLILYHPCRICLWLCWFDITKFVSVLICYYSCRKKSCNCVDMIWYYPCKRKVCADLILLAESFWLCWYDITRGKFLTVLIWYYPCRRKVSSQGAPVFTAWWHRMDLMRIALRKPPLLSWSQRRLLLAPWYELLKSCIMKKSADSDCCILSTNIWAHRSPSFLFLLLLKFHECSHPGHAFIITCLCQWQTFCVSWFLQQTGLNINLFSVIATDMPSH